MHTHISETSRLEPQTNKGCRKHFDDVRQPPSEKIHPVCQDHVTFDHLLPLPNYANHLVTRVKPTES